jgi:hypothetical protein
MSIQENTSLMFVEVRVNFSNKGNDFKNTNNKRTGIELLDESDISLKFAVLKY